MGGAVGVWYMKKNATIEKEFIADYTAFQNFAILKKNNNNGNWVGITKKHRILFIKGGNSFIVGGGSCSRNRI